MSKIELTGNVQAAHLFLMDTGVDKELRGVWFPQVEGKTEAKPKGEMVYIQDPNTSSRLMEAETKEEAIEKAKKWLREVQNIKPLQSH